MLNQQAQHKNNTAQDYMPWIREVQAADNWKRLQAYLLFGSQSHQDLQRPLNVRTVCDVDKEANKQAFFVFFCVAHLDSIFAFLAGGF